MRATIGWTAGAALLLGGAVGGWAPTANAQSQWDNPVRCVSKDGHYARCAIPWRDARLMKQESKAACVRGQSWGIERGVLWVDRGCRGLFVAAERGDRYQQERYDRDWRDDHRDWRDDNRGHDGWRPGPGWDREIRLQCDSNKKRYQMCRVDVGRHGRVRLARQMSDARCTRGYSWGWNRAGVWVDHGCRAQFVVERRW